LTDGRRCIVGGTDPADPERRADHWLSIAESFEFLPEEE